MGPVGAHGGEGIGDGGDGGDLGDQTAVELRCAAAIDAVEAAQPTGVAGAVLPFVVLVHDVLGQDPTPLESAHDHKAGLRMGLQ